MPAANDISGAALHAFVAYRKTAGERLYGIADAARDHDLAVAPRDEFDMPIYSLFDGNAPDYMRDVAPYLFSFDIKPSYPYRTSALLDRWAAQMGNCAGIFALSESNSRDMLLHLRQVFRVTTEDRRAYYLRFYDPRVLRTFLPSCSLADAAQFFGPIRCIFVESEQPGVMLSCMPGETGVKIDEILLNPGQGA